MAACGGLIAVSLITTSVGVTALNTMLLALLLAYTFILVLLYSPRRKRVWRRK